jgi:hypothetical protein
MIRGGFSLQTFGRRLAAPTGNICGFSSIDSYLVHPRRDIVSVRPEVATIAAVMFGCTPQECEKNGASLF